MPHTQSSPSTLYILVRLGGDIDKHVRNPFKSIDLEKHELGDTGVRNLLNMLKIKVHWSIDPNMIFFLYCLLVWSKERKTNENM